MALDESKPNDEVFEDRGITYLIEKELLEKAKPITLDFITTPQGEMFKLDSSMNQDSACGSCTNC